LRFGRSGSLLTALAALLTLLLALGPTTPATARYSSFGNGGVNAGFTSGIAGDCAFAADANLVRMRWPATPISAASVVRDWSAYDASLGGLGFLEVYGFDGHHIVAYSPVTTRAQIIKAANRSGIYAVILGGAHAVAVIGADRRGVKFVTWGKVVNATWAQWNSFHVTIMDAVTWTAPNTASIMFETNCGKYSPAFQVALIGVTEPVTPPTFVNAGFVISGWSTNSNGTGTIYQSGSLYVFTGNVVLWATWTSTGAPSGACIESSRVFDGGRAIAGPAKGLTTPLLLAGSRGPVR